MADLLLQAGIVFTAAAIGGALADRLGQSVIPAYILAGLAVGPHAPQIGGVSLSLVESQEFITLLSELGVVFLLFFIGLEFNVERLLAARDRISRAGGIDLAINFGVGITVAFALGFGLLPALFLAGVVYISSSAVITKSLLELGWIADPESEAVLGTLVFEDVVVAFYLALLTAVAAGGGDPTQIGLSLARSVALIGVLVALAAYGTPALERLFDVRSDERFLVQIVAITVLVGGLALSLGVSEAVAAFFLGAAFGGTSHAHRIERVITSERDLYAAVFFFSIGLLVDPATLVDVLVPLAVLVAVTVPAKLVSGYLGGQAYGLSERRSVRVGLSMVARGEFSLVLATLAVTAGTDPAVVGDTATVLTETIPALTVGYVLVTSFLGTTLMRQSTVFERFVVERTAGGAT